MAWNLDPLSKARLEALGRPVRVGLIGAGKFGSMFLAQVPRTPGRVVAAIADLSANRAPSACATVGWSDELNLIPEKNLFCPQNIVLSFSAFSGTGSTTSQCSMILPSATRKMLTIALPRSPG